MELLLLALRRLVAQLLLTVAMVAALAFAVGVLVAGPIYADGAERAIVFGYMERASPLAKDIMVQLLTPPGFNETQALHELRAVTSPLPISRLVSQEESGVARATTARGTVLAPLAYRDGLLSQVPLVEGQEPAGPDEVLLPQTLATSLGAGPGTRVTLSYQSVTHVTVTGIYSSQVVGDPLVFGSGGLMDQTASASANSLPILTSKEGFAHIATSFGQASGIRMEWDIEPDFAGLTASELRERATQQHDIASAILGSVGGTVVTRLGSLIPGAERVAAEGLAPTYLVALEVALVGLGVVIGVASLKLGRQSFELAVLKTRGARTLELMVMQAAEGIIAAVLAFPLALAVGLILSLMARAAHGPGLAGALFPIRLIPSAVLVGGLGSAAGTLAVVAVSLPHVRRNVLQERRDTSRQRGPAWLRLPYELLLLLPGAFALWELRRRGIHGAGEALDPLVLAAPTLLLLGTGMLAVRLLFGGFARAEHLADEAGSAPVYFAIRRLSRSPADKSLALLLILSLGLFAFASSLRTTVLTRNQDVARQRVGADWSLSVGAAAQGTLAAGHLPHHTTLAFYGSTAASSDRRLVPAPAIGIDPTSYAAGGWWQPEDASRPLPTLLHALSPHPIGIPLPPGVSSIQAEITAPTAPGLRVWIVLEYPDRGTVGQDLGPVRSGTTIYRTTAAGATTLLSIVLVAPSQSPRSLVRAGSLEFTFRRLTLSGSFSSRSIDLSTWEGLEAGAAVVRSSGLAGGAVRATFTTVGGGPVGGIAPAAPPVPALVGGVSGPLPRLALLQIGHLHLQARIVGRVRSFPTTEPGLPFVILPVQALTERFLQILQAPNGGVFSVLAMGRQDPALSVQRTGLRVVHTFSAARIEALLASSQQNLAIGMEFAAGVAGVSLAVLVLGLALYFGGRRREYEFSSLRAVGGRPRHAAIALALEYGLVLAASLTIGFVIGAGLLSLIVTLVTPSVTTTAAIPRVLVDWSGFLVAAAVAVAAWSVGLLLALAQARRVSTTAVLRGEPE